jgi:hypothetical protein
MTKIVKSTGGLQVSALTAFPWLNALFVYRCDPCKIANQIGMPPKNAVMFFNRLRQTLHVRGKQLQTLRQRFMFFGQTFQALIGIHIHILALYCFKGQTIRIREFSTISNRIEYHFVPT